MIITDPIKAHKLWLARRSPYLPMLTFDVQPLCGEIVKTHFPTLKISITVSFVSGLNLTA